MDDNLTLEVEPNGIRDLECFHLDAGFLGPFRPTCDGRTDNDDSSFDQTTTEDIRHWLIQPHVDERKWLPILCFSDITASFADNIVLEVPKLARRPEQLRSSTPPTRCKMQYLDLRSFIYAALLQTQPHRQSYLPPTHSASLPGFEYELFEGFLPP